MRIKKLFRSRNYFPTGVGGRLTFLVVAPIVLFTMLASAAYYQSHKKDSAARAALFASNIATISDLYTQFGDEHLDDLRTLARDNFDIDVKFIPDVKIGTSEIPQQVRVLFLSSVRRQLNRRLDQPFSIVANERSNQVRVEIQHPSGVLSMQTTLRAVFSRTIYRFGYWIFGAAAVFLIIVIPLAKRQARSIQNLTQALKLVEQGKDISGLEFTGPDQIRAAGRDLIATFAAIQRNLNERAQMLSSISHDLRTPLTRMKLQLEFAEDKSMQLALLTEVDEMEKLTDAYLTFAKSSARGDFEGTDVAALVKTTVRKMNKGNYDITIKSPTKLMADVMPDSMGRAISNLIANAIRYSEKKIQITLKKAGGKFEFTIEDNGHGIPAESRDDVLKPFSRLERSRNHATGGFGLGLAIVNEVVGNHRGKISLGDSKTLGGLKVKLELPLEQS
ncbi:MAG: ATP-binding protein [Alphaproteobacteria bacterium]|nr:ATP-binding protein [Alphaproteobacteria bacterium]